MTDTLDTSNNGNDAAKKWPLIVGALVIVAALIGALFLIAGDDDDETSDSVNTGQASDSTTISESTTTVETTEPPATTMSPTTSEVVDTTGPATTEVPPLPDLAEPAIWPWVDTDTRYADPVEAATGFATDFVGFDEPIVGEYRAGDNRSGEVEIRAFENGPATTVFVRQLTADDSWWILGAVSENIAIDEPETGAEVASPLTVSGTAEAFEGTVDVQLRADGNGEPIFEGFVTGGAFEPAPYTASIEFTSPGDIGGALVMLSLSSEDGSVLEASALRIFYR